MQSECTKLIESFFLIILIRLCHSINWIFPFPGKNYTKVYGISFSKTSYVYKTNPIPMKTIAISIPTPCHEDWGKMTPDAKGAFCASCQKSVYDFTNKSDEEIISVFEKKGKEKVCGRFAPAQLSRPIVSFGNASVSNSRLAKFVCALMLVFGAALFNGMEAFGQDIIIKGDVKREVLGKPSVCTTISRTELVKDSVEEVIVNEETIGDIEIEEDPIELLTGDTVIAETLPNDTLVIVEEPLDTVETIDTVEMINYIAGGISIVVIEPEEIIPTVEEPEEESIVTEETISLPVSEFDVSVSPNPSSGELLLSYELESIMPVKIDLFDLSGKLMKTLAQQTKQYPGKYNVSYSIADLPNGIYNVMIITGDRKVSKKVILMK
jgi:hypothetical protein